MRIGIDARFLTHPQPGGFKTYTRNLIAALADIDAKNEYVLYIHRPADQDTPLPDQPNFTTCIVPGSLPLLGMPWREQVGLSRQAARDKLDLLHSPSLTAPLCLTCPSVVTIHDMIWFFPERFSKGSPSSGKRKLMGWYYRFMPHFAARRAAALLTVSQAAKESIVRHLGLPPSQIFVTHEAAGHIYRRVDDPEKIEALRQKHNLVSDFILAIGSADPRKNIATLVRAYALLPTFLQEQYQLAIVWTHHLLAADLAEQIEALDINSRLQLLERVSDEELVLLYNAASLFVFPSLYEGFGLPLLEAMACGTPVVAANNSSIPEIVGEAALLIEAEDTEAMAGTIARVLVDEILRTVLIEKGLKRAASFSWTKCARQTVAVYRRVLSP
jgi:glycosyltransferase involved in cell wall biosynthesis